MKKSIAEKKAGKVFLVGSGTGDPELLTVKALRIIESADVILYDRLVSREIRQLFPKHTPARYVGKAKSKHSVPQDQLNEILVAEAKKGLTVCRLKGGDPFIFGRGSEEMLALKAERVDVEVVPGITAASGCTSYAGIPLTHRGISQACTFVTGHVDKKFDVDWEGLAAVKHTLVFYMGLTNSAEISRQLIRHGLRADMPVALIERGSTPEQRVVIGRLDELASLIKWYQVSSPALIVVGEVVKLANELQWFGEAFTHELQKLSA